MLLKITKCLVASKLHTPKSMLVFLIWVTWCVIWNPSEIYFIQYLLTFEDVEQADKAFVAEVEQVQNTVKDFVLARADSVKHKADFLTIHMTSLDVSRLCTLL